MGKKIKRSLLFSLTSVVLLSIAVIITIITVVSYNASKTAITNAFINQLENSIVNINQQMEDYYMRQKNNAEFLAKYDIIIRATKRKSYKPATEFLTSYFNQMQIFENLFISTAEKNPTIVCSGGDQKTVGLMWADMGFDDNIEQTLKGKVYISIPGRSPIDGTVAILITAPIKDNDQIIGILGISIYVGKFSSHLVDTFKIGTTGYPVVATIQGNVFAHPDKNQILNLNLNDTDYGKKIMEAPDSTLVYYTRNGEDKMQIGLRNKMFNIFSLATLNLSDIRKELNQAMIYIIGIGLIGVIFSSALIALFLRNRISPLREVVNVAEKLAEGDTDVKLSFKRDDEIGELSMTMEKMIESLQTRAKAAEAIASGDLQQKITVYSGKDSLGTALKGMVTNLSDMIREIQENARVLSQSSDELSSISSEMVSGTEKMQLQSTNVASSTEQVSTNINTMASAAEEMSVNVQTVSSTTEEMSQNMNAIAAAIEQMTTAIENISDNAKSSQNVSNEAIRLSNSASSTMESLGEAASQIGEVTEVIKRIADKTNLLALNATIEAASAGEAGKGFAVVANEIKELANQSSQAAEDIANRINGMQGNTENAVKVIADVSDIIGKINESVSLISSSVEQQTLTANDISANVQQTNKGTKDIATAISEVVSGANDMSKNAGEAAKGSYEVASNIHEVSTISTQANNHSQKVNQAAIEFNEMAAKLQELTNKFIIEQTLL